MRHKEQFNQLLEQQRLGQVRLSTLPADDAVRLAAADMFARLNAIEVPSDVAQRIEARVRNQSVALQMEGQLAQQRHSSLRKVSHRPVMRRTWIVALGVVAVLLLTFVGITTVAAKSLPGDPLYGMKQLERHVALAWAGDQGERASLQLTQLQQAMADLNTVVREHRSDAAIQEALATVAADTQASQQAVHVLPAGQPHMALEQTLTNTLKGERTSLHRLLSQVGWSQRVAFTRQLGALGEAVPSISGVTVSWDSSDTPTITITGKNFAPGVRLVIDGSPRGVVLSSTTTALRVLVRASDWSGSQMGTIGIVNPDRTAAQIGWMSGPHQHDQWGPGNYHGTPGLTPGMGQRTPWPGNDNGTPGPGMNDHPHGMSGP